MRWFEWKEAPRKGDAADHPAIEGGDREALKALALALRDAPEVPDEPPRLEADEVRQSSRPPGGLSVVSGGRIERERSWPTMEEEAYRGIFGRIVDLTEEHTEGDPVALLASAFTAFGSSVGRGPYMQIDATRHHPNLSCGIVGDTAKGRKGSTWDPVENIMHASDRPWTEHRIQSGLSSGEGLISEVRDRIETPDKDGKMRVVDAGVTNKRLLVQEGELSQALKVMKREGNTLSPVLRNAWDGKTLKTMVKHSPLEGHEPARLHPGPHHYRRAGEAPYRNRDGKRPGEPLCMDARKAVQAPALRRRMAHRQPSAHLASDRRGPGVCNRRASDGLGRRSQDRFGWRLTTRSRRTGRGCSAPSQQARRPKPCASPCSTLWRIALYEIRRTHVESALAIWEYAEESARYIFGDAIGDAGADKVLEELKAREEGMTRTKIRDSFRARPLR